MNGDELLKLERRKFTLKKREGGEIASGENLVNHVLNLFNLSLPTCYPVVLLT